MSCILYHVGVRAAEEPFEKGTIQIWKNGYNTGVELTNLDLSGSITDIDLPFAVGDYVNLKCVGGDGGGLVNVSLWFITQGVIGPTGEIGPVGEKGDVGETGDTGSQGPTGYTGPQGIEGPIGPIGPQGIMGFRGIQGEKGDTGEIG